MRMFSNFFGKLFGKRTKKATKRAYQECESVTGSTDSGTPVDILKNMYQLAIQLEQIEVDDANMAEVKDEIDDLPKRIVFIAKKIATSHGILADPTERLFGMDGTYDNKHTYKAWQDDNGQLHRGRPAIDSESEKEFLVVEMFGPTANSVRCSKILCSCDTFDDAKTVSDIYNKHRELLVSAYDYTRVIKREKYDEFFCYMK